MEKRINLFVTEQGSRLKVSGKRLFVENGRKSLTDVPLLHLRQIVIFGNSTFTAQTVSRLLQEGIFVTYLTRYGKFVGTLLAPAHSDGIIRKMQVRRSDDASFRLNFSREIIDAKVHNSVWLLGRRRRVQVDMSKELKELEKIGNKVKTVLALKELLGLEGTAGRVYFSALSRIFNSEFSFDRRKKHPSPDPLNALLSLSYSLLHSICFSFLHITGLDPYIGFFHEMRRGHASLASDLTEEFRAYVCDALVLRLVNQGYFNEGSFTWTGEQVFLTKEALKKFLREWAGHLDTKINVDGAFETTIWHLIEFQSQRLRRAITVGETYTAFRAGE